MSRPLHRNCFVKWSQIGGKCIRKETENREVTFLRKPNKVLKLFQCNSFISPTRHRTALRWLGTTRLLSIWMLATAGWTQKSRRPWRQLAVASNAGRTGRESHALQQRTFGSFHTAVLWRLLQVKMSANRNCLTFGHQEEKITYKFLSFMAVFEDLKKHSESHDAIVQEGCNWIKVQKNSLDVVEGYTYQSTVTT